MAAFVCNSVEYNSGQGARNHHGEVHPNGCFLFKFSTDRAHKRFCSLIIYVYSGCQFLSIKSAILLINPFESEGVVLISSVHRFC